MFVPIFFLGYAIARCLSPTHIPCIEQGGSILLVTLLYDLFVGLTI